MTRLAFLSFGAYRAASPSVARSLVLRFTLRPALGLTLASTALLPVAAQAQVTFNGAQRTLGSGFNKPHGVAVDAGGNIFVADTGNNAVKEVLAAAGYTTVKTLGSGFNGPFGVAVDASGNVYVADTGNNAIKEILAVAGSIPASNPTIMTLGSGFNSPTGVAVDAGGNVYIADLGNQAVKEIFKFNGIIRTLADVDGGLVAPDSVAVDANDNVFFTDLGNNPPAQVKEISAATGIIRAVGNGFRDPVGVALDPNGNVFVADLSSEEVYEVLAVDGSVPASNPTTLTLNSGSNHPQGVAVDASGNVFIADSGNNHVVELSLASVNFGLQPVASPSAAYALSFTVASGAPTNLDNVAVLTTGAAGKDFVAARSSTCLPGIYNATTVCQLNVIFTPLAPGLRRGAAVFIDSAGNVLANVPLYGIGSGPQVTFQPTTQSALGGTFKFEQAYGVAVDGNSNVFAVSNNAVQEILAEGGYTTVTTLGTGFISTEAVAVDGSGNIFVVDDNEVKEVLASGGYTAVKTLGTGFSSLAGIAVDGAGNVLVSDAFAVKEILATGGYTTVKTLATFNSDPKGLAVDGSGNIFVALPEINAVKEMVAASGYTTISILGSGLIQPQGVAVDASGNVFVSDLSSNGLKEILADGGYTTVNLLQSLSSISVGITLDGSGNLIIANYGNNGIEKLNFADPAPISFPIPTSVGSTDSSDGVKTVSVWNSGNEPLVFSAPATGNNPSYPSNFPEANYHGLCDAGTPLPPGASCDLAMNFVPTKAGVNTGSIVLMDNALNGNPARQSIALSGTGLQASQTITFGVIPSQSVGTPLDLLASSSSGLTVSFASKTGVVCSVAENVASFLAAGTCTIQASQAGNSSYLAATPVSQSFTVTATTLRASGLRFIPVTPCRVADTRNPTGPFGGPEPTAGSSREFDIPQSVCNIPSTAVAYSLNVTVVPDASLNYLTLWPSGEAKPFVSTLNSDGRVKANAAVIPAGTNGGVSVFVTDPTQVILDIDGYFVPAGATGGLQFYPVTPCRIADTRQAMGSLGGPFIPAGGNRAFPVQSSNCNLPATAHAYSVNVTAIPHTTLNYLTIWPTGETQPYVSTLNSSTGAVTANAAIVPAGSNGDISVFVYNDADVILDVNGYFAPPATGGLSLYTATPCRVIDTRPNAFTGTIVVNVQGSVCAPPSTAEAYVLNATVVPVGALNYLTLWPDGVSQPYVSTLNADDGAVTSNMAIVPTTNGSVDTYVNGFTNLILDLSGYFAP